MPIRFDDLIKDVPSSPLREGEEAPKTAIRMDELVGMEGVRVSQKDFDFSKYGFSEEEANAVRAKGKIGPFESFERAMKMENVPVFGLPSLMYEAAAFRRAIDRLQKNEYGENKELQEHDSALVDKVIRYAAEEQLRGYTRLGGFVQGVAQLPAYMVEFAIASALAMPGSTTAARAASTAAVRIGLKGAASRLAGRVATGATVAAVGSATAFAPRVATKFYQNEAALNLTPTKRGLELNRQAQSAPFTSFAKALGDTYIELFSESAGTMFFNPAMKRMGATPVLKKINDKIVSLYKKLHPTNTLGKLYTKAGWDGFISEIGEEVLGDQLRAIFNVQDFGSDGNVLDRMFAAIPDGDELAVMMGVLAVPGATNVTLSNSVAALSNYRKAKKIAGQKPKKSGSLAQKIAEQDFDPVEATIAEAIGPRPQVQLSKEEAEQLRVKQREGKVTFEGSKPIPDRQVIDEITSSREFKEADKDRQMQLLIQGRTKDLDRQRVDIEKRMTALEKKATQTKRDVNKLELLSKQLLSVHAQISDVIDSTAEELSREQLLLPGQSLESLRKVARRVGARIEGDRVREVFKNEKAKAEERRAALVKYLQARLPGPENAKTREKFMLRAAKDMTEKKLQKFFTQIEELRDTALAGQLRDRAKKIMERMSSKVVKGVKKGVFANANIQELVDEVVSIANLSAPAVEEQLRQVHERIVALYNGEKISLSKEETEELKKKGVDVEDENEILEEFKYQAELLSTIGGLEQRGVDDMEEAVRMLARKLAEFQTGRDMVRELRKAQWKAEQAQALKQINESEWKPTGLLDRVETAIGKHVFKPLYSFNSFNLAEFWKDLGIKEMIADPLQKISEYKSALEQKMDRPVQQAAFDIYGVSPTSTKDYMRFLVERMSLDPNAEQKPFIKTVVLNNGTKQDLKLSRWDVMYWYGVAYQEEGTPDPQAYEILTGENALAAIREQVEQIPSFTQDIPGKSPTQQAVDFGVSIRGNQRMIDKLKAAWDAKKAEVQAILDKKDTTPEEEQRGMFLATENQLLREAYQEAVKPVGAATEADKVLEKIGKKPAAAPASMESIVAERAKEIKGNAIPADVLEDMFSELSPQDRQFALAMRKIFTSFWPLINPVYARATGVNMTRLEQFIPWIRKTASIKSVEDMFTQYAMVEGHVTPFPGSTKERNPKATAPFAQISLMEVFMGFRDTMSHWIATHDITARQQKYLKNRDIRDAINRVTNGVRDKATGQWHDGTFVKLMDYHLKGIVSRGRTDQNIRIPFMDFLRRNISRYYLVAFKQLPLQVMSMFTAILYPGVGFTGFIKGVGSFMRDPKGAADLLNKALAMHNRYDNLFLELRELQQNIRLVKETPLDYLRTFDKYAYFFVKAGNKGGVLIGGWAVFKSVYDKSGDIKKAFEAFDEYTLTTQQSALREQQSAATVGYARYFFQFVSAVGQYGRIYYRSWANLLKEQSAENITQWARTMVVFHGMIPVARWAIAQIGLPPPDDEEESEKRKKQLLSYVISGPFSGLWLLGDMGNLAAYLITGQKGFDTGPAVISQINKTRNTLGAAIRKAMDDDSDPDEVLASMLKAGKETGGLFVGVPGPVSDVIRMMFLQASGVGDDGLLFTPEDFLGVGYGQSIDLINYSRGSR